MSMAPEPLYTHGKAAGTAIVLCNLGTPDEATTPSVRRYLAEFLSDHRVIEIPRWLWWLILYGVILRVRPKKSAAKYAAIWLPEGSPLRIWTTKMAVLLAGYLGQRGHRVTVHAAMRYGNPSIASVLDQVKATGATRVLVVPLYPQYSATTTASTVDAVAAWAANVRSLPELRFVNHFHDDPGYINALARRLTDHWQTNGRPDRTVLSFHGVPKRTLELGDPYHCECRKTARLLAERLGMKADDLVVTFQSRFGRAEWLQPYTEATVVGFAKTGVKRVDVMCPGFTADCLETLEEVNIEVRAAFLQAGGAEFFYVPALNDSHEWIAALSAIAARHMQGWDTQSAVNELELDSARARAIALGARN